MILDFLLQSNHIASYSYVGVYMCGIPYQFQAILNSQN